MQLSIIIPIYNVEPFIDKCLNSIYSQGFPENLFEVIAVNDGTPDNSMASVEQYAARHDNLIIVNQQNQGLSVARNNGMAASSGDYVWFVDSDDWLLPDALQVVAETVKSHPEVEVFATVLMMNFEDTGNKSVEYKPNFAVKNGRDYMFRNHDANCGACQRYIFKRSFLDEHRLRFMPHVYHEDGEFSLRMLYLANCLMIVPQPLYNYRLRSSGSIMSSRKMQMNYDLVKIYRVLEDFCKENVADEDFWLYKAKIFACLYDTILFSRREIFSEGFRKFYKEYKGLIHEKAGELLLHPCAIGWKQYMGALHFYFCPLFYTRLKTFVKNRVIHLKINK